MLVLKSEMNMTSKLTNNNSNNNNNNFIYTAKIDQLNLNIKTAGINLCTVDKIFQISVSNKKYQKLKGMIWLQQ